MRSVLVMTLALLALTVNAQQRDPTRPPSDAEVAAWFGGGSDAERDPPYRLQSILLGPNRRIAIIDGRRLRTGERLGDAEVTIIEPGRVVLDEAGETIELTLATHLDYNIDDSRD